MTTVQLLIVCLTAFLIVLVTASQRASVSASTDVFAGLDLGQEIVVHIADGQSVRGSVIGCEPGRLLLGSAVLVANGSETKIGGTVRISSRGVALVQEL